MNAGKEQIRHDLFLQAAELSSEKWENFLKKKCTNDAELKDYVLNLLHSLQSSNDYFEEFEQSILNSQLNEIDDHLFKDINFGNYKIISVLKQGGMGSLFLARRADGEFKRDVVIKMIPVDLNSQQAQNQFAHEKEILASLSHPNIVQLYDSGMTQNGQSYFVMELIKGKTLIEYCNDNKSSINQRLTLFSQVLRAVGFAHQHLIIHGDIKPSNIMVNEDGHIKLLDFGISRIVNKQDIKLKGYSLNYLTPEHKNKTNIITTTDTHQLGQLLFELLSGILPHEIRTEDFDFPLLSIYAHEPIFNIRTHSKRHQIKTIFKSDLQYILAKALSPNPQNRYASVQVFEEDLKLFKQGYCVSARENTFSNRVIKYLKRNKLLSASLTTLIVISTLFSLVVFNNNKILIKERDNALMLKNLITDVFSAADPATIPGKELTAVEALDMGLQRVRERFDGVSDTESDLLAQIAVTYQNLGKYQKANAILQQVFDIRKQLHPNNKNLRAQTLIIMAENLRLMSRNKEARKLLEQSLELLIIDEEDNAKWIASTKDKLGQVLVLLGQLTQAEKLLKESTALIKKIYGHKSLEFAEALNSINSVYFRQGKYQQVQQLLTQAKQIREHFYADSTGPILDIDYATNINNLGLGYYLDGDLKQGESYFRQALELRDKIYIKPHPDQAQSLTNLGLVLNDLGRANEALIYLQKALSIRKLTLSKGHMRINDALNNLAMVYHENQSFSLAEQIYAEVLPKVIKARGENHPQTLAIMTNRAKTLLELEQFQKAHNLFEITLNTRLKSLPENHIYLTYSYLGLGQAQMALGDLINAEKMIDKALKIRQNKLPEDNWLLGEAYLARSRLNIILNKQDDLLFLKACNILKQAKGEGYFLTQRCQESINLSFGVN